MVTNDDIARQPELAALARRIAQAGTVALHARAPGLDGGAQLELARVLQHATVGTPSQLFVNDRADVARLVDARGVHLPADGIPVGDARRMLGANVLIGKSTHSPEQALRAHGEGADYVFLGPIWETPSHPGRPPLGPEAIAQCAPARVIAIGGVTAERARGCREAGAFGVAVISTVWRAPDPVGAVREILLSLHAGGG